MCFGTFLAASFPILDDQSAVRTGSLSLADGARFWHGFGGELADFGAAVCDDRDCPGDRLPFFYLFSLFFSLF